MPRMPRQSNRTLNERARERRGRSNIAVDAEFRRKESSAAKFDRDVNALQLCSCFNCSRQTLSAKATDSICSMCRSNKHHLFTNDNNMNPGEVPDVLKNLTPIEELLIAKIHPVVTYFKIRGGQTGYRGNVINFRQNITRLHTQLPASRDEMARVIVGVREGSHNPVFLTVRSEVVRAALEWLKLNHAYYHDIVIDQATLDDYQQNPDLSDLLQQLNIGSQLESDADNMINESFFPVLDAVNQDEQIQSAMNHGINWPVQDPSPVNEFSTDGYISQAFPVLFPYGRADFNAPRQHRVTATLYFKYLMSYGDKRFAKHSRFRFFAMNSVLRWQSLSCSSIFISRNQFRSTDASDVARRLLAEPTLRNSIMVFASQLRSTQAYWKSRAGELLDMVNQLGPPTVFFTLSAADYHWNKLFQLICPDVQENALTDADRRRLMHENPLITSEFFRQRVEIFRKDILKPVYAVEDYWMRYEWQFRGSPHVHGLLWLAGAPKLSDINSFNEAEKQIALDYCAQLTKAINPNPNVTYEEHPCRKTYTELTDKENDLAILLNAVQRHTRCGNHCLRKKRGSNQQVCRFGFPHQLTDIDSFEVVDGIHKFLPRRNDMLINLYNPYIIQTWRANIDFNVVTSVELVLRYIVKYVTKAEVASVDFNELVSSIASGLGDRTPGVTLIRKLLQASLSGRDYSAQEVCHVLMGWPLFEASRTFANLNLSSEVWSRLNSDETAGNSDLLICYARRPINHDICLFDYAKKYKVVRGQVRELSKPVIVRVFPRIKKSLDPDKAELFAKQQVQLFIPWWTSADTLKDTDVRGGPFNSWLETYSTLSPEALEDIDFGPMEDEFENVEPVDGAERNLEMALARLRQDLPIERPLGDRLIDHAAEWDRPRLCDYSIEALRVFLASINNDPILRPDQPVLNLTPTQDQTRILDLCRDQITSLPGSHRIKRVLVQGKAGTGKSFLIKQMVSMISSRINPEAVRVLAPTGVAATNINGSTYHSCLRMQINFTESRNNSLRNFQLQMEGVKFLIFDEVSMIGLKAMRKIEQRCREPNGVNEVFGGYYVYFFGDLQQLPPVFDDPVFKRNVVIRESIMGRLAFSSIQQTFKLSVSMRQNAQDQQHFRQLLEELSLGQFSIDNYNLLMTRLLYNLPQEEQSIFNTSMHLYSTNRAVKERNQIYLASTGHPVAQMFAEHNCATAKKGTDCQASCLESVLELSRNSRVMPRRNLKIDAGLVNGALGTVTDIVYSEGRRSPALAKVIMVRFDQYYGRLYDDHSFPILPVEARWIDNGIECTRKQFPLNLAYAITIHKSQGLTLDRAVIDIGNAETSAGLSYVAFSRVRSINDLAIANAFPRDRLDKIQEKSMVRDRIAYMTEHNLF